ncbi:hypothetical protein AB4Y42_38080 [Paraburkholderia sp. EG286B]|uniref:hypothetical protein n=1 Tax=Paraburkholderia sp. EG286B TaxID=3237011 RepID=UPI0034D37461
MQQPVTPSDTMRERNRAFSPWTDIDKVVVCFSLLAVALRLVFWNYTHLLWEDGLITLSSAQNLWDGLGLTGHTGEAPVYSFSSPLAAIILVVGEAFSHGMFLMRVLSIASAVLSIYYAAGILRECSANRVSLFACLAYLACDHLLILFGMGGMETQIAATLALATAYYCMTRQFLLFGLAGGLAVLARLELALVPAICYLYLAYLALNRKISGLSVVKSVSATAAICLPWVIFTWIYYGSPVPQTVNVKKWMTGPIRLDLHAFVDHTRLFWEQIAPFREFPLTVSTPVPDAALLLIVLLVVSVFLIGTVVGVYKRSKILLLAIPTILFYLYHAIYNIDKYYPWYIPPFFAMFFVVVGFGFSAIAQKARVAAVILSGIVGIAFAAPFFFCLNTDRLWQQDIETGIRHRVGEELNIMMKPGQSVVLEPLGYIGGPVRTKVIYDKPGLGSKIAFDAYKKYGWGMIDEIKPDFVVLRKKEVKYIDENMPAVLSPYERVAHIYNSVPDTFGSNCVTYNVGQETDFSIYKRIQYALK